MFRHVVMFKWKPGTPASARTAAVEALRRFGEQVSEFAVLSVGADAGISAGNYDTVVVVDFASADDYRRYAADSRHVALIETLIRPHLESRVAVQTELS